MFRNSRPRPSPQTIELIRQLAYISGGALCGVTALYLEECRRRIQIVQRVLDKRRAIIHAVQSRRYSRVAVAARFDDADTQDIHFLGPRLQNWYDNRPAEDASVRLPVRQSALTSEAQDFQIDRHTELPEPRNNGSVRDDTTEDPSFRFSTTKKVPPKSFRKIGKGIDESSNVIFGKSTAKRNEAIDHGLDDPGDHGAPKSAREREPLARARAGYLVRFHDVPIWFKKHRIKSRKDDTAKHTASGQQGHSVIRYHKNFERNRSRVNIIPGVGEASHSRQLVLGEKYFEPETVHDNSKEVVVPPASSGFGTNSEHDKVASWGKVPFQASEPQILEVPKLDKHRDSSSPSSEHQEACVDQIGSRDQVSTNTSFSTPWGLPTSVELDYVRYQANTSSMSPERLENDAANERGLLSEQDEAVPAHTEFDEPVGAYAPSGPTSSLEIDESQPQASEQYGTPSADQNFLHADSLLDDGKGHPSERVRMEAADKGDRSLRNEQDAPGAALSDSDKPNGTYAPFAFTETIGNEGPMAQADGLSNLPNNDAAWADSPSFTSSLRDDHKLLAADTHEEDSASLFSELFEGYDGSESSAPEPPAKRRKISLTTMPTEDFGAGKAARNDGIDEAFNERDLADKPLSIRKRLLQERLSALDYNHVSKQRPISDQDTEALWPYAVRDGSFADVCKLYQWMKDNDSFTTAHSRALIEASSRLKDTASGKSVLEFCAKVLNREGYGHEEAEEVFEQKIRLLTHALTWNILISPRRLASQILTRKSRWVLKEAAIVNTFEHECKNLLSTAGVPPASRLLMIALEWLGSSNASSTLELLSPLTTAVMNVAVEDGETKSCTQILRQNKKFQAPKVFRQQFNAFVEFCGDRRAFRMLADSIVDGRPQWSSHWLTKIANDSNKAVLAIAFCSHTRLKPLFEKIDDQVPKGSREFVNQHASAEALRTTWTSTRNIDTVEAEVQRLSTWLTARGDDIALSKLDDVLLDVYLSSGKHERAVECLARMHEKRHDDVQFVSLAALHFAKRWDWDGLTHLMDISKAHAPFRFDADSTRSFNEVIRFFIQRHTPLETWMFISSAIDELGFSPNFATVQLMLYKIIRSKNIDLVPRWLRFLSAIGAEVTLTGPRAADLVRQYYIWNRQPTDLMFRLCHSLTASVSHFHAGHFKPALKMAIGHDVRFGGRGRDGVEVQRQAMIRLDQLRTSVDIVPESVDIDQHDGDPRAASFVQYHMARGDAWYEQENEEQYNRMVASFNEDEGFANSEEEALSPIEEQPEDDAYVSDEGIDVEDNEWTGQDMEDNSYRIAQNTSGDRDRVVETLRRREVEEDMALSLSMKKYQEMIDSYHSSSDATGLPISVRALKHATDASIRMHEGDTTDATNYLANAKKSGMDVTRAMDPLLIYRSSVLTINEAREARRVCDATIEYYVQHFKDGHNLRYALAHTVANVLVFKGHADQALRLLSTIFQSDYILRKIPSIKTMSVWVKAYAKLLSMDGVRWVVRRVLFEKFPIDRIFLHDLEKVSTFPFPEADQKRIRGWLKLCQDRRLEQDLEAKIFGKQLVDCLIEYAHKYKPHYLLEKEASGYKRPLRLEAARQARVKQGESANDPFGKVDESNAESQLQSQDPWATYLPYTEGEVEPAVGDPADETVNHTTQRT